MKTVEYLFYLSGALKDRLRVEVYREKKEILQFVVQYEGEMSGQWYPIVRYDTRHGFAHRDRLYPDGSSIKEPLPWDNYNLALTYATQDLKYNWYKYRREFEEKMYGTK